VLRLEGCGLPPSTLRPTSTGGKGEQSMRPYLQVRLLVAGVIGLVCLWGCATIGAGPRALVFTQVRGQIMEQVTADTRACQQMGEQAPPDFDQYVRPAYRNLEPRSLRVQINCMTGLGYIAFMTHGQTMDQFRVDMQVCVPTAIKGKKVLSADDIHGIAECMAGRGYFVAT